DHRARGALRRSAVVASQPMSPWRSSARKALSASPAPSTASAEVKRTASKPSALASSAILAFSVTPMRLYVGALYVEIEVSIGARGSEARNAVLQQRPERGPRFQQRVPVLGRFKLLPRDLAEKIEGGQMRGSGEIGKAQGIAGKPAPRLGEMADIGEMIPQVVAPCAHRFHIGRGALWPKTPKHFLLDEIGRDLFKELAVEPVGEPPRLGSRRGVAGEGREGDAAALVHGIAEVF